MIWALRILAYIWFGLVAIYVFAPIVDPLFSVPVSWEGPDRVKYAFVALAPGVLALVAADWLDKNISR